ncbi:hypothetical protein ACNKHM_05185 [Shigella sonnei]
MVGASLWPGTCIYYGDEVGLDGKTISFAVSRSPAGGKAGLSVIGCTSE